MSNTNNNNPFDSLFGNVDLSQNDFLKPTETSLFEKAIEGSASPSIFDQAFQQSQDLFPSVPEAIEEPKPEAKEEPPVVPAKEEIPVVKVPDTKADTKKKASEVSKNIKAQMEKKANMKVDPTWEVAYAGNRYNPPHEMTLDELRQYLELDYPEMSKERCRMDVEEDKKLIVPMITGAKKG